MNQDDVRRIALALPGAVERPDRFAFAVPNRDKLKDFAWPGSGGRLEPTKAFGPPIRGQGWTWGSVAHVEDLRHPSG